jgi:hypothetical protein
MVKTVSEHVTPLAEERPAAQAIAPRPQPTAGPPPGGDGRPPAEPLHPGMYVAAWVWLVGFSMLFLQILAEGGLLVVQMVRALLGR